MLFKKFKGAGAFPVGCASSSSACVRQRRRRYSYLNPPPNLNPTTLRALTHFCQTVKPKVGRPCSVCSLLDATWAFSLTEPCAFTTDCLSVVSQYLRSTPDSSL